MMVDFKHYFIGDKRVASRIGSGSFNNIYGQNGSYLTAGQQDYAERMSQIETQREDYYRELGIAPGIPTMKGSYGDPENTGVGYNTIIKELGDHTVPAEWAQYVKNNEVEGSAPGAPIQWDDPSDPETALPGYGFVADNSIDEETFYYHSDHLGSTSYITDGNGNITQYDAYLPYGELLVDEHSSCEEMPYKFNGKELDEETGLYYYGARYMQPIASIWYGVDPLTEKYKEISGYVYCHANPIILFDPDGEGDYYNENGTWLGRDKNHDNKVFVANKVTMKDGYVVPSKSYKALNITHENFVRQASTVYGESSAYRVKNKKMAPSEDLKNEMYAIASVHQRNKRAYGVSSEPAKEFRRKTNEERNEMPLMKTAIAAEINALVGGFDYSYGASMWDGAEQSMYSVSDNRRSADGFELHMNTMGWNISPDHYKKWKNNVGKSFKAPMIKKAVIGLNKGKSRLISTAVYGRTIFWRTTR